MAKEAFQIKLKSQDRCRLSVVKQITILQSNSIVNKFHFDSKQVAHVRQKWGQKIGLRILDREWKSLQREEEEEWLDVISVNISTSSDKIQQVIP